jgi:hypothetical protein
MFLVTDFTGAKPKKRGSIKTKGPPKFWFTLDSKLLTWHVGIDGAEVDYLHLGKVVKIEAKEDLLNLTLKPQKGKTPVMTLKAFSDNPSKPPPAVALEWAQAIEGAIKGEQPKQASKQISAAVQQVRHSHCRRYHCHCHRDHNLTLALFLSNITRRAD